MPIGYENPTSRQKSVKVYLDRAKPYLDNHIGDYPKVIVGTLDQDLTRFAGLTATKIDIEPSDGQEMRRKTYLVQFTRTGKGMRITPQRGIDFSKSKAVIFGSDTPDDLIGELMQLKADFGLEGVLYLSPSRDGEEIAHRYVNHSSEPVAITE